MVKRLISLLRELLVTQLGIARHLDQIKENQGLILSKLNRSLSAKNIREYEFRVFSQWGEDGIIQRLTEVIDIRNKTFIEFGVEDFFESNCRYLMAKDNWSGFVLDGSSRNISRLKNSNFYWKHQLEAKAAFITRENINELLDTSGFDHDLGILSIDLDGIDYYILDTITDFKPRILICEFNPVFGGTRKISVPYKADFSMTRAHYTNLYCGASLAAIADLANRKGYALVGTNSAGQNAFFVRRDLLNESVSEITAGQAYSPSSYRESRDKRGVLNFVSQDQRLEQIRGLPVLNIETNEIEPL